MKEKIKAELLELNFNVDSVGIIYWIDAIICIKENPLMWDMKDIYEYVAQKNNSTASRVERSMRFSMGPAKEHIQKKYNYHNKIRNRTYLELIKYKLI